MGVKSACLFAVEATSFEANQAVPAILNNGGSPVKSGAGALRHPMNNEVYFFCGTSFRPRSSR